MQICDIEDMTNFVKGMSTVGQLYPQPYPYPSTSQNTAWSGVANSFRQAGDDLRKAIKECSDAQRENKQKS